MRTYRFLLALSALLVAGSAAFFSVSGIAELFAGSFWPIVIMAGSLELGKLVAASFLHRYWDTASGLLKTYLTIGVVVLMGITSMGIFGFLTDAYEESASELQQEETQISSLQSKNQIIGEEIKSFRSRREQLTQIRSQQTERLNTITGSDSLNANEIGYLTRQTQDRIESVDKKLEKVNEKIGTLTDSSAQLESRVAEIKSSSSVRSKLGPLLFVAREFDTSPDTAVKWFTLMIIFVFDPLAVSLVLAFNTTFTYDKERNGGSNNNNDKSSPPDTDLPEDSEDDDDVNKSNEKSNPKTSKQNSSKSKNVYSQKNFNKSNINKSKEEKATPSSLENLKKQVKGEKGNTEKTSLTIDELFSDSEDGDDRESKENEKKQEKQKNKEQEKEESDLKMEKGEFKEGPVLKTPDNTRDDQQKSEDEELDEFVESFSGSSEDEDNFKEQESKNQSQGTKRVDFHGSKKTEKNGN